MIVGPRFEPPAGTTACEFAGLAGELGFLVAHESGHLRRRGWLQIATMGDVFEVDVRRLFAGLGRHFAGRGEGHRGP